MATPIEKNNPLQALQSILDMTKGKTQTQTTSSNISKEGAQALIQQILQSTQGLAAVSSGQKSAGLYNSTTNQQMVNDLLARVSGEVAKQQAGTTTVTKQEGQVNKSDALTALGLSLGKQMLGPSIKGLSKKAGVDNLGDKIADILGLGSGASSASLTADAALNPTTLSAGTSFLSDFGASLGLSGGASAATDAGITLGADLSGIFADVGAETAAAETTGLAASGVSAAPVIAGATYGKYQFDQAAEGDVGDTVDSFFPGLGNSVENIGKAIGRLFGF